MKFKYRLIFFAIGVVGMIVLFFQLEPETINWNDLFNTNTILLFLGLFFLWFIIYSVHALSYLIILGEERKKISFFSMLRICVTGFALNNVTPAGLIGGEPYRILELKKYCSTEKSSSSTLTFSLFYIIGHVTLWITSILIYLIYACPGETYMTVILCVSGAVCVGGELLFFLSKKKGFVLPFMNFLAKIPLVKKPISKILDKKKNNFIEIDENIKAFRTNKKGFWSVFCLQYVSRLLEAVEYMVLILYFGAEVNYIDALLVFGTASLIGNLLFIIPMQAGTREGGLILSLLFLSIEASIGTLVSIVYRVRDFICVFVGIMLVLIARRHKEKEQPLAFDIQKSEQENNDNV